VLAYCNVNCYLIFNCPVWFDLDCLRIIMINIINLKEKLTYSLALRNIIKDRGPRLHEKQAEVKNYCLHNTECWTCADVAKMFTLSVLSLCWLDLHHGKIGYVNILQSSHLIWDNLDFIKTTRVSPHKKRLDFLWTNGKRSFLTFNNIFF